MTDLMDDSISRNSMPNAICHYQNAHRVSLYPTTEEQNFSPSHFGILHNQITKLQGAHLLFLVGLVSFMCNTE
jgi:hypothetical protein